MAQLGVAALDKGWAIAGHAVFFSWHVRIIEITHECNQASPVYLS
jgi:hypothetical protein